MKQDEGQQFHHAPFGFSVTLDHNLMCQMGGDMLMSVHTKTQAETCAQFIRDRCADIDLVAIEM